MAIDTAYPWGQAAPNFKRRYKLSSLTITDRIPMIIFSHGASHRVWGFEFEGWGKGGWDFFFFSLGVSFWVGVVFFVVGLNVVWGLGQRIQCDFVLFN